MNRYMQKVLSAYLASAAISLSPGISSAMLPAMEDFPMTLVDSIMDEILDEQIPDGQKLKMLTSIAADKRAEVRIRVCELLAHQLDTLDSRDVMPLLSQLAGDRDPSVRNELRRTIAGVLEHADVLTRTTMIGEWAFSSSRSLRYMLVTALKEDFFCLGLTSVLSHLSNDPNVLVRRAVVDVAIARMNENPVAYKRLLDTMTEDTRQEVRYAARHGLQVMGSKNYSPMTAPGALL
ncbi:MAG: hypothetical protein JXX14_18235 [Deltaproteobacteria bacterium]|nr:hypothetical protein [Deltaproteobacteria bacterium]